MPLIPHPLILTHAANTMEKMLSACYFMLQPSPQPSWTELKLPQMPPASPHQQPPITSSPTKEISYWSQEHLNNPPLCTTKQHHRYPSDNPICVPTVSQLEPDQGPITAVSPTREFSFYHTVPLFTGVIPSTCFFLLWFHPLIISLATSCFFPNSTPVVVHLGSPTSSYLSTTSVACGFIPSFEIM